MENGDEENGIYTKKNIQIENEREKIVPMLKPVIKCIHVWKYNEYACVSMQHRWWVSKWANINGDVHFRNVRDQYAHVAIALAIQIYKICAQ